MGRLPPHLDAEERLIVVRGHHNPDETRSRTVGPQSKPMASPRNMMIGGVQSPESGMPIQNRAARRREEAKKRTK